MKAYLIVAGLLFSIITITHVVRAFVEDGILRSTDFIASTLLAVAMALWAFWLLHTQRSTPLRPNEELKPSASPSSLVE